MGFFFRLAGNTFFLTYRRCPLLIDEVILLLQEKVKNYGLNSYAICSEYHQDDDTVTVIESQKIKTHLHVLLKTDKRIDTKDPSFFDLKSVNSQGVLTNYHGDYQATKKETNCYQYYERYILPRTRASSSTS